MANENKVIVTRDKLDALADSISAKSGESLPMTIAQMKNAVDRIDISGGGITPTGTKNISITQNGTTTEDVTAYANAEISVNVVNQDYENALEAFGVQSDLTDGITALTTYANSVTEESDTNLSDAVRSLADGYGGGGLEYEEGTYTPEKNELPTIQFANSHTKAPAFILLKDTGGFQTTTTNIFVLYMYVSWFDIIGFNRVFSNTETRAAEYFYSRMLSSTKNITIQSAKYDGRNDVTATGFSPYAAANNFFLPAGHTFKWIAIWK